MMTVAEKIKDIRVGDVSRIHGICYEVTRIKRLVWVELEGEKIQAPVVDLYDLTPNVRIDKRFFHMFYADLPSDLFIYRELK